MAAATTTIMYTFILWFPYARDAKAMIGKKTTTNHWQQLRMGCQQIPRANQHHHQCPHHNSPHVHNLTRHHYHQLQHRHRQLQHRQLPNCHRHYPHRHRQHHHSHHQHHPCHRLHHHYRHWISIRRIFPVNDSPNLLDHDFPTPGYLITPSGYLEMKSAASEICRDEMGREHFKLPVASAINLFLRGPRDSCNIKDHIDDLVPIIKGKVEEGVQFIVIIADGGPDFNPNHLVNQVYWTRMFRMTGLQGMIVTTYCPGHSALNPIEHLWAPLTNCLAGVYLPDTLENESQPPTLQTNLSVEERESKENAVFNGAMDLLINYWNQVKWAGLQPKVSKIPSRSTSDKDYKLTHSIVNGPLKGLTAEVEADFKYMADHMDRRVGQLIFSQCGEDCGGCHGTGALSNDTLQLLKLLRQFPSPAPAVSHEGHFLTFLEAIKHPHGRPDEWMPRVAREKLGQCPHCRSHIFTSETNKKRHLRMFHR